MFEEIRQMQRNPFTRKGYEATIKKNEDGEYVVKFWKDGKWLGEGPTYYTDDKADAEGTAKLSLQQLEAREVRRNPELLVWRNPGPRGRGLSVRGLVVKRRKTKMRRRRKHRRGRSRNGKITAKLGGKRVGWRAFVRKYKSFKKAARMWRKAKKYHGGAAVSCGRRRRKSRRGRR